MVTLKNRIIKYTMAAFVVLALFLSQSFMLRAAPRQAVESHTGQTYTRRAVFKKAVSFTKRPPAAGSAGITRSALYFSRFAAILPVINRAISARYYYFHRQAADIERVCSFQLQKTIPSGTSPLPHRFLIG